MKIRYNPLWKIKTWFLKLGSYYNLRDKAAGERIYQRTNKKDYGIMSPPISDKEALEELLHHFLGPKWYDCSGATSHSQVLTNAVFEIECKYKGCEESENELKKMCYENALGIKRVNPKYPGGVK